MTPRPPWSIRKKNGSMEDFYTLREGIPDGLQNSLVGFLSRHFTYDNYTRADRVEHLARITGRLLPRDGYDFLTELFADEELLFDAIDHALAYPDRDVQQPWEAAREMKSYLDESRHVYDVIQLGKNEYELGFRQPPELSSVIEDVTSNRSRASEHLRRAWSLGFSRDADPNNACIEATKAVEAAAKDTITPNDQLATLGRMIGEMKAKPEKWFTDLGSPGSDDLMTVIGMMKMMWDGQLRHGNPDEPLDVSVEQCQMIVHTAAILVHWFQSGRVRRVSS